MASDLAAPASVEELRERLSTIGRLTDAVPHIMWTTDAAGNPTYLNARWTEYTGLDLARTLQIGGATLLHPDDLGPYGTKIAEARKAGQPAELVYRLKRASDQTYRWHHMRFVPIRSAEGVTTGWVATATDIDDHRKIEDERQFLIEASRVLGTSLDLQQTLNDVARLAVPRMADWCAVDLLTESDAIERAAVAHVDPSKIAMAWELWKKLPPKRDDPQGMPAVLRTGKPDMMEDIPDELLAMSITDPELLALTRSLGLRSFMCVPLKVRDRVIGALTLVWADTMSRRYVASDIVFASELADRMAVAVDNARLYEAAKQARRAAEALAADVVEQSRAVEAALAAMMKERDAAKAQRG